MTRRLRRATLTVAITAASLVGSLLPTAAVAAPPGADLGRLHDYVARANRTAGGHVLPGRYLVRVTGTPGAVGGNAATNKSRQDAVIKAARLKGVGLSVDRSYTSVWNGFAARVSDLDAAQLESLPGVTGVYPVVSYSLPDTRPAPEMKYAVDLTGASVARDDLGWTGRGIKVGVIDSGIDLDHPDLGGSGVDKPDSQTSFPTSRVQFGYDFVGDGYDSNVPANSTPRPDPVPDDCNGHGTHVAGIIGANGVVKGVAPEVTYGAYRVFGCTGSTDTSIVIAALERAQADGMDVVNLSLGSAFETWPDAPDAQAANTLSDAGVVVVNSAGNSGEDGQFSGGSPGVASKSITVASIENSVITGAGLEVDGVLYGYGTAAGAPSPVTGAAASLVVAEPLTLCTAPVNDLTGRYVLAQRGTCTFRQKAMNAQAAGAKGLVLYNNQPGVVSSTVEGTPAITIPVMMLTQADGEAIRAAITASSTLTPSDKLVETPNAEKGLVSSFSSWGLAADLDLKPDLAAPGGNIWSTYPLEKGGYANESGTSMASPHVAGIVALVLQARPELKGQPLQVRELLQNTSVPTLWRWAPQYGLLEQVIAQGAGLVKVDRALASRQSVTPGKWSLKDLDGGTRARTFTVTNASTSAITYLIGHEDAVGTAGASNPEFDIPPAQVGFPGSLTVPAGGSASFTATVAAPAGAPNGYIFGGYFTLTAAGASTLSIPYAGMAGDYQSLNVIPKTNVGTAAAPVYLPSLGTWDPASQAVVPVPTGKPAFSMKGDDTPYVLFHIEYPVADILLDLYAANRDGTRGAFLGTVFDYGFKHGRDDSYTTLSWDGHYQSTTGGKVRTVRAAAGSYLLGLRLQRPLTEASPVYDAFMTQAFGIKSATAATGNGIKFSGYGLIEP